MIFKRNNWEINEIHLTQILLAKMDTIKEKKYNDVLNIDRLTLKVVKMTRTDKNSSNRNSVIITMNKTIIQRIPSVLARHEDGLLTVTSSCLQNHPEFSTDV